MNDILDEVQEDLRREQMKRLWERFGNLIIACALAIVVIAGGNGFYQNYKAKQRAEDSKEFTVAMDLASTQDRDAALAQLKKLDKGATSGYKTLAAFSEASLKINQKDLAGAAKVYDDVAKDGSIDSMYRDLAVVYGAYIKIDLPESNLDALNKQLTPLAQAGQPWRASVRELQALIAAKQGKAKEAQEIYAQLAMDNSTPASMRERAQRMQSALSY